MERVDGWSTWDERHGMRVTDRLGAEFAGVFGPETVAAVVADSLALVRRSATVTAHLPLLVERFARERLRAAARTAGVSASRPAVVFVCTHNAARSQMAAGWLRRLAGERVEVWSAGSQPIDRIGAPVIEVMAEVGVDLADEYPKRWTSEVVGAADVVVTMGCGDACPVHPGPRYEDWTLDEPADPGVADLRRLRDEIRVRVEDLVARLATGSAP